MSESSEDNPVEIRNEEMHQAFVKNKVKKVNLEALKLYQPKVVEETPYSEEEGDSNEYADYISTELSENKQNKRKRFDEEDVEEEDVEERGNDKDAEDWLIDLLNHNERNPHHKNKKRKIHRQPT